MTTDRFNRLLPLAGIVAGLAIIAGLVLSGAEPADDATSAKIVAYYSDHKAALQISALCAQVAAVALLFFAAGLRTSLRSRETGEASYSTLALAGAVVTALGLSFFGWTTLAAVKAVENGSQASVAETIHLVGSYAWMPWAVGAATMLIGAGLGGLRTVALPRPLAWITVALGVIALTPGGPITFALLPLWLIGTGIVLARADRRMPAASSHATASAAY
jgi:hypothetical protein